jgi:hypothetical protein
LKQFEADQAAADREEGFVDVIAAFIADAETAVLMKSGDRALDDPAFLAEAGAVSALRPSDPCLETAATQLAPTRARVIRAIAIQLARPTARSARTSPTC